VQRTAQARRSTVALLAIRFVMYLVAFFSHTLQNCTKVETDKFSDF